MKVDLNDVKEDYKRKDDEIEALKQQLTTAQQEATAYRISLENLEASIPKIKADAVLEVLSDLEHDCNGWAKDDAGRVYWHDEQIRAYANKLEAGE